MSEFKMFRSVGEDIRVTSPIGHTAIITKELISLPSELWGNAYSQGAVSSDMKDTSFSNFIEEQKLKKEEEDAVERESIKESLRTIFNNPVGVTNAKGELIHRKAIATVGKPVKKDVLDSIWSELVEESGK